MNDFDYIQDGGFVIECKDGQFVGVSKEQGDVIQSESEFLAGCFRHGTMEACSRVLKSPDWSVAIARHIIEVLYKGKTTVSTLQLYEELIQAGDYACLDLRLCSLVNYLDVTDKEGTQLFSTLVDPSKYRFRFRAKVESSQWFQLLAKNILLYREETNFVVKVGKTEVLDQMGVKARKRLDTRTSEFLVHTDQTIKAVLQIAKVLGESSGMTDLAHPRPEQFSIYFETTESMPKEHHELIDRLAGGESYIRTCADASVTGEGYTVLGSFDLLRRALRPLIAETNNNNNNNNNNNEKSLDAPKYHYCSLRVDNPSPDTLGRLINAAQNVKDFPNTLGLDSSTNRYFCKKTARDIDQMLEYLADFSTRAEISGDFQLEQVSSDDDPY
jgi:hypothetical protein